ncbi:hypothetical protein C6501_07720, partial [Candidatus Poribacteria bacterium]
KIDPGDPFSANPSIRQCVNCATRNNAQLANLKEDFYQIAFLTILERMPEYDPNHPSGASLTTFIKACVCNRLWAERRKALRYVPFPLYEQSTNADKSTNAESTESNPLIDGLNAEAETCETLENEVIRRLEVESFSEHLPQILAKLSERERCVLEMKFLQELSGAEIAEALGISKGRVSQITKIALAKVEKIYRLALEAGFSNL